MPPEVLKQLGSKADGVYLLTQQAPPSDKDNPGIQQMLKELKDAGFPSNGDELSPAGTGAWANVHTLVDILKKLPPSEIATLDSAKLVDAMAKAGPINRPEIAPFDFTADGVPRHRVAVGASASTPETRWSCGSRTASTSACRTSVTRRSRSSSRTDRARSRPSSSARPR